MKRVGIYLRVSTEEQARLQDGSLTSQRQRLIDYVESQNRREASWGVVVDVYCDEGLSAKDMKRPEFQRLLSDIKSGRINLILATELSRLSRSIHDFCELWALFKKHGTSMVTLREQFDTTTASGEMMIFNLINYAQYERKQTAERISANWQSRAKRGLWNGGTIPFGFDRNPIRKGELLPHPTESKQVREIFDLFLEVGSVRKTCFELTKRGIFSKRYVNKHGVEKGAREITVMSLQRILTNRAYIGLREIGVKTKKIEVVKANWEALIDLELFNRVQERLALNKNKFKPAEWKRYPFPLTELLICGECGKHLGGKSGTSGSTGKHFYYGHPRQLNSDGVTHLQRCQLETVRAERIENTVLESLKTLVNDSGMLGHWLDIYAKGTMSDLPAIHGKIKTLETDIQTQERRNENLIERLSELPKNVPADGIYKQIQANTAKVIELKSALESIRSQENQMLTKAVDRERLLFRIRRTIQNLERTPVEDRRGIYGNLIKFAELHPTKVRLGLYAPVAALKMKKAGNEFTLPAENLSSIEEPEGLRDCSSTVSFGA
jgi:site-specific DNA recombinase